MYMGLKEAFFAPGTYTDAAEPTYTGGASIGGAMSGNMSMTYDTATGYANGRVVETANGATGGTITYQVDGMTASGMKMVFGFEEISGETGVLRETDASSPEGGFSFYRVLSDHGTVKFECWHILRTRLHMSAQDLQQRTESTQFTGLSIEGPIMSVQTGASKVEYRRTKTVTSETDAIAWCKTALSIT